MLIKEEEQNSFEVLDDARVDGGPTSTRHRQAPDRQGGVGGTRGSVQHPLSRPTKSATGPDSRTNAGKPRGES